MQALVVLFILAAVPFALAQVLPKAWLSTYAALVIVWLGTLICLHRLASDHVNSALFDVVNVFGTMGAVLGIGTRALMLKLNKGTRT